MNMECVSVPQYSALMRCQSTQRLAVRALAKLMSTRPASAASPDGRSGRARMAAVACGSLFQAGTADSMSHAA